MSGIYDLSSIYSLSIYGLSSIYNLRKIYNNCKMGTHTISNSSTLQGWLESVGLDDILLNPCACIFGEDEPPPPVPLPGKSRFVGVNKEHLSMRR